MAQIFLKEIGRLETKESTEQLFELIEDNKQFIFVDIRNTIETYIDQYNKDIRIEYYKTAINKAHILQAF